MPPDGEPTGLMAAVRYADGKGRYAFVTGRDWAVVTGRTDQHLVLRLLAAGEFVAQATVTAWKPAAAGGHQSAAEFKAAVGKLPGWEPGRVLAAGEIPTDPGRWLYRLTAAGRQDGAAVVQSFYALAGPGGDQVTVTVVCRPDAVSASRDAGRRTGQRDRVPGPRPGR